MDHIIDIKRKTHKVKIGDVCVGGDAPVVVQSMTNTDTANIDATVNQVVELANAGSEIVRVTVNTIDAAKAVPIIKERLMLKNINVPLVGCFHYNGHTLLTEVPECAQSLDKYRINPGNVGFGEKRDKQFEMIIKQSLKYNKPVRIGVNWGSMDQDILAKLMDENAQNNNIKTNDQIIRDALVESALSSAKLAEKLGKKPNEIIISCKVSKVQELVKVYEDLASKTEHSLHLGLTEAGMGVKGIVASSTALAPLLLKGIGDTIRVSTTPKPGQSRTEEVLIAKEILQSLGLRAFAPQVSACPGCGRTTSTYFQELAERIDGYLKTQMPIWSGKYKGVEEMNVAVMGCIVNGPGESKHADIGISLPGTGEAPVAPIFIDGRKAHTLRGDKIAEEFLNIVEGYVEEKYGAF